MALHNAIQYARMIIDGERLLKDLGNRFLFVSQREYRGKSDKTLAPGATLTLQVTEDHADPGVDKRTGRPKENNVFNTLDVTVVGVDYPLPFAKGDMVSLGGFMPEASYYIDYNLILRFREIRPYQASGNGKDDK